MAFTLKKFFDNFGGLNLRTPELLKNSTYATDTANIRLSENFSLSKRRGYQIAIDGHGGAGATTFNNVNLNTGVAVEEKIIFDSEVKKVENEIFEIYLNVATKPVDPFDYIVNVNLNPVTQTFEFKIEEILDSGNLSLTIDLGTGLELTYFDIADLIAQIEAWDPRGTGAYYFVDYNGDDTVPAAFIKSIIEQISAVNASSESGSTDPVVQVIVENVTTIDSVGSFVPLALHWANRTNADWELNSSVQLNDVLYITNYEDGLLKYDGSKVYKAGLLKANDIQSADEDESATDKWRYIVLFRHTDNKENVTVSEPSNILIVSKADAPTDLTLDISNIEANGYDLDNIDIELYRTIENGGVYYLVDTKTPADAASSIISFANEAVSDDAIILLPEYIPTDRNGVAPPACKYVDVWRNQLVLTGNPLSVNTVYIADIQHPEGFDLRNSLITGSRFGGPNTGIKSLDNHLYVFKAKAINMISGDISAGALNVQVDTISDDGIGSLSHNSIVEAYGSLYFLTTNGIYSINKNGVKPESEDLTPLFVRPTYVSRRVISIYWVIENKIIFLLPEINASGEVDPESKILVKDLIANAWYVWNNIDFSQGISIKGEEVWFCGDNKVTSILNLKSTLDYADHQNGISTFYKTHWENLQEPAIPKKFNRIKVYSIDTEEQTFDSSSFTLEVTTNKDFQPIEISSTEMSFGADENEGWGLSPWGLFAWGNTKKLEDTKRLNAQKCRSLRVVFTNNNIHENILVSGFELEVATPYMPALKGGQ